MPLSKSDSHSADSLQESQANDRYIPLLSSCFVALKNSSLYPPGHQQIAQCMEQAHKVFVRELSNRTPLIFGVAKDVLIFDEVHVGPGVQPLTDFAGTLNEHGIVSLTFHKGLDKKSLIYFFQLLSCSPEEAAGEGGIQQELLDRGCGHIDLVTVDYNLFQLSGQDGQNGVGGPVRREGHGNNIWLRFTKRLLREGFSGSRESSSDSGEDSQSDVAVDPVQLANFINENRLDINANLSNYGLMLDGMLGSGVKKSGESRTVPDIEHDTVAVESMNVEAISMVVTMLDELNPALRTQFLATTIEKCQENITGNSPTQLLSQLPSTLVLEMLDMANEADREISPALLSLIQGLSSDQPVKARADTEAPSLHEVETLMARENYEEYVEPDYDKLLQILGQNQKRVEPPAGFILQEQKKTLEERYLINQTTHLLLALMEKTENEEEYSRYGEKLIEIALDLPSFGIFTLVETISTMLSRHAKSRPSPTIQHLAEDCLDKIEGREYIESIAALLPEATSQDKERAIQALIACGTPALSELLDFYCEEKENPLKGEVETFFHKYRVETLAEIVRRLPRLKRDMVLLLLSLAENLGVGGAAPLLRPMLSHLDDSIRMSALEILLPRQDSEAIQYLRDMLHSSDTTVVASALTLAWKHKTAPLVPDLIALIDYRCLREITIQQNGRIILALCGIADPAALPALEKLADSKWIFHSSQVEKMKDAIFISLSAYPLDSVIPLCKKGLKSKQREIRKTCRTILSRAGKGKQP